MRVFAIVNQKGGVGKTTTCVNLSAVLAARGHRVLTVDIDPQMNATIGVGVDRASYDYSVYDLLTDDGPALPDVVIPIQQKGGWDLLPASTDLIGADIELSRLKQREFRLRKALSSYINNYDFVLIDCPPALTLVTLNALVASDGVIIPLQCEYYALEGLRALLDTLERVQQNFNPALNVEGVLRTMYDPRSNLTRNISKQLDEYFGDKLYRTVIPRNVRLAEAPGQGLSAYDYDKFSKGAVAYEVLALELLNRHPPSAERTARDLVS